MSAGGAFDRLANNVVKDHLIHAANGPHLFEEAEKWATAFAQDYLAIHLFDFHQYAFTG